MTVTAVVCSFWGPRKENVHRIVDDLLVGSMAPDHIIVLDNGNLGFPQWENHPHISVVSGANWECRGKFVAALLRPADYYLLHDDDTTVGRTTLEHLVSHGRRGFVTGYWGVTLTNGSFMHGAIHQPFNQQVPLKVDAFHGRVMFMAHDALVRTLAVEEWVRGEFPTEGDDIIAGLANPEGSFLIPMSGEQCFVDLAEEGVAMQYQEGYFAGRDRFTQALLEAIDTHGIPSW